MVNFYQCRRKLKIEVNDVHEKRDVIENVIVLDPSREFCLHIPECISCKYGLKAFVLKSGVNPNKETYTIKSCKMKRIIEMI